MTPALLSLDEPTPGTACERCGLELRILGFCPECFERSMQAREQAIRRDHETARKKARTWQLGRVVNQ